MPFHIRRRIYCERHERYLVAKKLVLFTYCSCSLCIVTSYLVLIVTTVFILVYFHISALLLSTRSLYKDDEQQLTWTAGKVSQTMSYQFIGAAATHSDHWRIILQLRRGLSDGACVDQETRRLGRRHHHVGPSCLSGAIGLGVGGSTPTQQALGSLCGHIWSRDTL